MGKVVQGRKNGILICNAGQSSGAVSVMCERLRIIRMLTDLGADKLLPQVWRVPDEFASLHRTCTLLRPKVIEFEVGDPLITAFFPYCREHRTLVMSPLWKGEDEGLGLMGYQIVNDIRHGEPQTTVIRFGEWPPTKN